MNNGQSTAVSALRGRPFIRDVNPRLDAWQGYDELRSQVDEGFSLEFNPLLSTDRRSVDAMIKCQIDQVEKLVPVMLEVPTQTSPRQRPGRGPADELFPLCRALSLADGSGFAAGPGDRRFAGPRRLDATLAGLPLPLPSSPARADLLVIIESKGPVAETPGAASAGMPVPVAGPVAAAVNRSYNLPEWQRLGRSSIASGRLHP